MLNRTISLLTAVTLVVALPLVFRLTEPSSLLLVGGAVAAVETCFGLAALHRRRMGISTWLSVEDTPLSAFIFGLKRSSVELLVVSLVLATSWVAGVWQPAASKTSAENGSNRSPILAERNLGEAENAETMTAGVSMPGTLEHSELHAPFQYLTVTFHDEEGRLIDGLHKEQITLRAGGVAVEIVEAAPVVWHRPLYWLILRDASNSVLQPPFPKLIEQTSAAIVREAFLAGFPVAFRVVDFSNASHEVSPWSRTERDVRTTFQATATQSSRSAVFNAIADGNENLANCLGGRRMTVITDLGDNFGSKYSLDGLVAQARSAGVVIDVVTVPTEQLTEKSDQAAKRIANAPSGQVIDAASPALEDAIRKLVHSADRPLPAYRIIFKGDGKTQKLQVTATMSVETSFDSVQVATRP